VSDDIEVRPARDEDADAVAEQLGHLGYPASPAEIPARLARLRARGEAETFVALAEHRIVGLATVHARDVLHQARPVLQLTALVVAPDVRGRGVGRALVGVVEQWAADRGADRLVLTTALHRAEAPGFYERLGFEHTGRRYARRIAALVAVFFMVLTALPISDARAQVRERRVSFDSAGLIFEITPPFAARLSLAPPAWPVSGDYLDAHLYAVEDTTRTSVLVVRRPRDVLERWTLDETARRALADAVTRGVVAMRARGGPDSLVTQVSDRTQGWFVANQTLLGTLLFGPSAAAITHNAAGGTAAYLALAGGTFFLGAAHARRSPISAAENHLAWHGARQGAAASYLAAYLIAGDDIDRSANAATLLVGGIAGDIIGYRAARGMTDAEAHGVSHGAFVGAALAAGTLFAAGNAGDDRPPRGDAGVVLGALIVGYPLGLLYVHRAPYRVTAGDVGTLVVGELLGVGALGSLIPDSPSDQVAGGLLTGGFALGAVLADQALVRRFDYTDSESRLLQLGTVAGGVVGVAIPVLSQTDNPHAIIGAATLGGLLGAIATHKIIAPVRANAGVGRSGSRTSPRRVGVHFTPSNLLLARSGRAGEYPVLNVQF
jgi:GNAT superfamily N-acetyltransferase